MRRDEIKNWLVKSIRSGTFPPDTSIPTRHTIMRRFKVARSTVDRVIKELIDDRILYGVRGGGTYVGTPAEIRDPLLYIITDWINRQYEDHEIILDSLEVIEGKLEYKILNSIQLEKEMNSVLRTGSCVIWDRPQVKHFSFLSSFNEARIPQLILNRRLVDQNYIVTDTGKGIQSALDYLQKQISNVNFSVMAPALNSYFTFLAEREMLFNEICIKSNIHIKRLERYSSRQDITSRIEVCRKLLTDHPKPAAFFLPYNRDLPHFLGVVKEFGLEMEKDVIVITYDFMPEYSNIPGVIFVEQNWHEIYQQAMEWALSADYPPIQANIAPKIRFLNESTFMKERDYVSIDSE